MLSRSGSLRCMVLILVNELCKNSFDHNMEVAASDNHTPASIKRI